MVNVLFPHAPQSESQRLQGACAVDIMSNTAILEPGQDMMPWQDDVANAFVNSWEDDDEEDDDDFFDDDDDDFDDDDDMDDDFFDDDDDDDDEVEEDYDDED